MLGKIGKPGHQLAYNISRGTLGALFFNIPKWGSITLKHSPVPEDSTSKHKATQHFLMACFLIP